MLTSDEYASLVVKLAKPGEDIFEYLTTVDAHRLHMLMGLTGEVGELVDAFKKDIIYGKALDRLNVIEELGDIEFYLEGLRQSLSISRDEVLVANITKLNRRFPEGSYSDRSAQERADKVSG